MKLSAILVALMILCSHAAPAQELLWRKEFGGPVRDYLKDGLVTPDGGYLLLGFTTMYPADSSTGGRAYLVRTDRDGALEWQKVIGRDWVTRPEAIFPHDSNRFIIIGVGRSKSTEDILAHLSVLVVDDTGAIVSELYQGEDSAFTLADVKGTSDGGFIVTGSSSGPNADARLWKLDRDGRLEWQRRYPFDGRDYAVGVIELSEGGFLISGSYTEPPDTERDVTLRRTTADGRSLWLRRYAEPDLESGHDLFLQDDGTLLLFTQRYSSLRGTVGVWRMTSDGEILSRDSVATPSINIESVRRSTDGGFVVAGWTTLNPPTTAYIGRLSATGSLQWQKTYATDSASCSIFGVLVVSESESLLLGSLSVFTGRDALVLKIGMPPSGVDDYLYIPARLDLR